VRQYYYADENRQAIGPVGDAEVFRLLRDGVLTPDSPLMVEGAADWQTVRTLVRRQPVASSMYAPPTPGKWLLNIYVIDEAGDPAGFFRMLVREWIGKPISMFVFCLGYLWILVDQDNQGWHDKLVDTYVVED
jgi:hypothetical protein